MSRANHVKSGRVITLKLILFSLALLVCGINPVKGQGIAENFDNVGDLPARGWFRQNNSVPVGLSWHQGNPNHFPAQSGAPNSFIEAGFGSTSGANTISNWLLTPIRTFSNGDVIKFWTRTVTENPFPDRLQVRMSTNGASIDVGTGPNAVGDFTTLLLTINPNLEVGGYPEVWTQYTITLSGLPGPTSGRIAFRYFVTDGGPMGDNSNYIGIDTFSTTGGNSPPTGRRLDFNGDGKTDYVVARNMGGAGGQMTWFINNGTTHTQTPWGVYTDFFVSGDFDGDDKADITVYRPTDSSFYTLRSTNGTLASRNLGMSGDNPTVVGDYDGDGIDDFAVYRQGGAPGQASFWFYRSGSTPNSPIVSVQMGQNGDVPAPGDYDGDGRFDFCVRTNYGNGQGLFLLKKASGAEEAVVWGTASDLVVPGDYDGDGKDDFAVVRADGAQLLWSVLGRNSNNIIHYGEPWGLSATDFTTQGDYDGDGKTDLAVWRPSDSAQQTFFYIRGSSTSALSAFEWGQQGDYPVAAFNSH
jgi:hypothetical protein